MFQICDAIFTDTVPVYIKNTGDGFFATFSNPGACLEAALTILKRLAARNRVTQSRPIDVRMGLHYGEMFLIDEETHDRHGNDLNIAFRVEGVSEAAFEDGLVEKLPDKNRIVATSVFFDMRVPKDAPFKRLGKANLKGIKEPVELYIYTGNI